ncbi:MAG: molybdopterin-guanine dinucleotide biosynthesis protein B [Nitrospirae bacterium]|nr:molybdopterin-guanine dinucleotide biosynthesis protein B [Nitrospirota bacterium]
MTNSAGRQRVFPFHNLMLGVCGYSGSGKTTLIEAAIPPLCDAGFRVAVIKHDRHGLDIDRPGSDTARFTRAGAVSVLGHGPRESILVTSCGPELAGAARLVPRDVDIVLVEGHKSAPIRRVWLEGTDRIAPPESDIPPFEILQWGAPDRLARFLEIVRGEIERSVRERPLRCGILIGGKSSRMGRPKAGILIDGEPMAARIARVLGEATGSAAPMLLGAGHVPESLAMLDRLPDATHISGPIAGLVAAMRWSPESAWLICAVDMPRISPEAIRWLLGERRAGRWAVMPHLAGKDRPEPLFACYEPMIMPEVETMALRGELRLRRLADHLKVATPAVPEEFVPAFTNLNTPEDLRMFLEER